MKPLILSRIGFQTAKAFLVAFTNLRTRWSGFFCEFLCFFVAMRLFFRKEAQKGAKKSKKLLRVGCGWWKFLWILCFLAAI
jgi:hypothetical protein